MDNEEIKKIILELAEPIVADKGLIIWGLEVTGKPPKNVRLFVDTPEYGNDSASLSATIDQCEEISRQLGLALDVEDCMPVAWTLEVSSPGLERTFYSLSQLARFKGDLLDVVLASPVSPGDNLPGRSRWRGKLVNVGENDFILEPCQISAEGEISPEKLPPVRIPWNLRKTVRRLHIFQIPAKPGKSKSRKL